MTTFLQFVIERVIGPPYRRGQHGQSYWNCPFCDSKKFYTLPFKLNKRTGKPHKERWLCWSCHTQATDVFDFLRLAIPKEDYSKREDRVAAFQKEYTAESQHRTEAGDEEGQPPAFSSRGERGEAGCALSSASCYADPRELDLAWANLTKEQLATVRAALAIAKSQNVPLCQLATYDQDFEEWAAESAIRHKQREELSKRIKASIKPRYRAPSGGRDANRAQSSRDVTKNGEHG